MIQKKNPSVRFVVTAITLETMANLIEIAKEYEDYRDMQMMEVQANSVDVLAGYHMRHASNPVLIAVFGGK